MIFVLVVLAVVLWYAFNNVESIDNEHFIEKVYYMLEYYNRIKVLMSLR